MLSATLTATLLGYALGLALTRAAMPWIGQARRHVAWRSRRQDSGDTIGDDQIVA